MNQGKYVKNEWNAVFIFPTTASKWAIMLLGRVPTWRTLYSLTCCMQWSTVGGAGKVKKFMLGSLLSSLFHWLIFFFFTIACQPSITSKLCHPVLFDAEHGMPTPRVWDEASHSNLEVEGKDKNSRLSVGLPRCVAASRGISWHSQNECSVGSPEKCGKSMVLETRGPWEFEKISFCLKHQIWESVTLELYLWSPG